MIFKIYDDKVSLARAAADHAAHILRETTARRGTARVVAASAASQFEFLEALTSAPNIDWTRIELFHLDEYIGLPMTHPASFCHFLQERLISKTGITNYHLLNGEENPRDVIARVNQSISEAPIDVAFVGIGENGHLAFNDPPADFQTEAPYIVVNLDEPCRTQQVGEGWFADLSLVPKQAISMSIRQVLKAREILAIVPDARKAQAIGDCFNGAVSPMHPSSILRNHAVTSIYLDQHSASKLTKKARAEFSSQQARRA